MSEEKKKDRETTFARRALLRAAAMGVPLVGVLATPRKAEAVRHFDRHLDRTIRGVHIDTYVDTTPISPH